MESKPTACHLKYLHSKYLTKLFKSEDEAISAIGNLIDDLHNDKKLTTYHIINQVEIDEIICQLFSLLKSTLPEIVSNTAFILGTLAEFEEGRSKLIHILSLENCKNSNSLEFLISLLDTNDPETLLNVTGTISSLVESIEGRHFILSKHSCLDILLVKVNHLLSSADLWIGSNAALIIARLSIDEDGNTFIHNSSLLEKIVVNLVYCLTIDSAGRGMNSAFALGRIFDNENVIQRYHSMICKMKFIEKLINMTDCTEMSFVKNSCFCLNSVMGSEKGYDIVVTDRLFSQLILNLERLLILDDDETIWFGVLTLKVISKKPSGCRLLRKTGLLYHIKLFLESHVVSKEVRIECEEIISNLTPPRNPDKPNVTLIGPHEVFVTWNYPDPVNDLKMTSLLFYSHNNEDHLAYRGNNTYHLVTNLEPNKKYEFYLKFADIDLSGPSESISIVTNEDYPSSPANLRIVTCTSTQIKISWDEPEKSNGFIKHYIIHMNKRNYEQTKEKSSIISGLQSNTRYHFTVCAVNSCGKGASAEIEGSTLPSGAHAPDKPNVIMLGRSEANLTWNPPEAPLGKIFRYEVKMNNKIIIYSGIQTYCKVSNLRSDTEYGFSVIVVTSEGKYESPICRKKTGKDEYFGSQRSPLYEPKMRQELNMDVTTQKLNNAKTQKNFLASINLSNNSETGQNLKSIKRKPSVNLIHLLSRTSSNDDYLKENIIARKNNDLKSPKKLQPLISHQPRSSSISKSLNGTFPSTYNSSISVLSISSGSIEMMPSANAKISSDTFVTNMKSRDSIDNLDLEFKKTFESQENSDIDDHDHSKKMTVIQNSIKIPIKNLTRKVNKYNL